MGKFLASESFDAFLLEEGTITTYNTFIIDGHQNEDFYSPEEWTDESIRPYALSEWKSMRSLMFELIKGKRTPLNFKFVLHLKPKAVAAIIEKGNTDITPEQISAFVLNIRYDGTSLVLVTGTAYQTFLLDKSAEQLWDKSLCLFLNKIELEYDIM